MRARTYVRNRNERRSQQLGDEVPLWARRRTGNGMGFMDPPEENPYDLPRRITLRDRRDHQDIQLDTEAWEQARILRWRSVPGSRFNGWRQQHFPFVTTTPGVARERDRQIDTGPWGSVTPADQEVIRRNQDFNAQMDQFILSLFNYDDATGHIRHTNLSQGNRRHTRSYRQTFGSGEEPFIGWDYFILSFVRRHNIQDPQPVGPLDTEPIDNRTDVYNSYQRPVNSRRREIHGYSNQEPPRMGDYEAEPFELTSVVMSNPGPRMGQLARTNGVTTFELQFVSFLNQTMDYQLKNFRSMSLLQLLTLFRLVRTYQRGDRFDMLAVL